MFERVSMNLAQSRQTGMKLRSFAVGLGTLGLALALVCAPVGISDDLVSVDGKAALATPGNGISHGQGKAEFCDSFLSVLSQTPNKRGAKRDTQRSPRSLAKRALNWAAAPLGVKIVSTHDWSNTRNFIPFEITIKAAQGAGLSIGDYIDSVINNIPGATQATIDGMSRLGVFSGQIAKVVEIGPGSGRYLEKTIEACSPSLYEIYETAGPWASYIVSKFNVALQPTDGKTLRSTPEGSADLVHAHKVFNSIPFVETYSYWTEMARVARSGAHVVFDIMTEDCLDSSTLEKWVAEETGNGVYPAIMPRSLAIECFESRGFALVGTYIVPLGPGRSETFVFRKN